jgi:deazaflavin-dependent oxidoreductase (nitroreductase family)
MKPCGDSVAILTHFGRKSGKPFQVQIWWVELDGGIVIGSMDRRRGWVRNLEATGRAVLDRGRGEEPVRCEWISDTAELERFRLAIRRKYPIMSRLLALFFQREGCAFRARPTAEFR